jgi:transposase
MKDLLNQIINDRGQHAEKFREKIAFEVLFEGKDPKELVEEYQLASIYTVNNWVEQYRGKIEQGLITLPAMTEQEKQNLQALKQRVKELEKSLEHANVLIYGLNSMIDYAEKEMQIPIRKKRGTKRS